jgi:hypothetical protein
MAPDVYASLGPRDLPPVPPGHEHVFVPVLASTYEHLGAAGRDIVVDCLCSCGRRPIDLLAERVIVSPDGA